MTSYENLSVNEKVRAAIHRDVRAICVEICHCMGLDITRPANAIIAELVLSKVALYGVDLEAFAKHAKRSTINADDVKLLVRRNPSLKDRLSNTCRDNTAKDKRRKTTLPIIKTQLPLSKKSTLDVNKKISEPRQNPVEPMDDEHEHIDLTM